MNTLTLSELNQTINEEIATKIKLREEIAKLLKQYLDIINGERD